MTPTSLDSLRAHLEPPHPPPPSRGGAWSFRVPHILTLRTASTTVRNSRPKLPDWQGEAGRNAPGGDNAFGGTNASRQLCGVLSGEEDSSAAEQTLGDPHLPPAEPDLSPSAPSGIAEPLREVVDRILRLQVRLPSTNSSSSRLRNEALTRASFSSSHLQAQQQHHSSS